MTTTESGEYVLRDSEREIMENLLIETLQSDEFDNKAKELANLILQARDSVSEAGLPFHRHPDEELSPEASWYLNCKLDDELAMAACTVALCSLMVSDSVGDKVSPETLDYRVGETMRRIRLISHLMLEHGKMQVTARTLN